MCFSKQYETDNRLDLDLYSISCFKLVYSWTTLIKYLYLKFLRGLFQDGHFLVFEKKQLGTITIQEQFEDFSSISFGTKFSMHVLETFIKVTTINR